MENKKCAFCGKEFVFNKTYPNKMYCSRNCRVKAKYRKNKPYILKRQSKWQKEKGNKLWSEKYKNNKEFRKKRQLRDVTIKKVDLKDKICENCGIKEDLHRHHLDYSNPKKIIILCRKCHNKLHFISPII